MDLNQLIDQVKQAADSHVKHHPTIPLYATFDFDNTCILNDLGELALFHQINQEFYTKDLNYLKELLPKLPYLSKLLTVMESEKEKQLEYFLRAYYDYCGIDEETAYILLIRLNKGNTPTLVRNWFNYTLENEFNHPFQIQTFKDDFFGKPLHFLRGFKVNPAMDAIIKYLESQSIPIYIISGSFHPLVMYFATRFWNIPEYNIRGMKGELVNNQYTENVQKPYTYGSGKIAHFPKEISGNPFLAAGDSNSDYPMLTRATSLRLVRDRGTQPFMNQVRQHITDGENWIILPEFIPQPAAAGR